MKERMNSKTMVLCCCDYLFWLAHKALDFLQVKLTQISQSHRSDQGNSLHTAHIKRYVMAACLLTNAVAPVEALDYEDGTQAMISSIEGNKQVQ